MAENFDNDKIGVGIVLKNWHPRSLGAWCTA